MITIVGELLDPVGHSHHGRKVDTAEVRSQQEDLIPLTVDHDQIVGRVLTLTRVRGGSIYAVAVADDRCDPLLDLEQPIYLSPTVDTRAADSGDGLVLDAALVFRSGRVAPRPVVLLRGDVRYSPDRYRWALRGLTAELVDRAAEELRGRPATNSVIHVVDLERQKRQERENERSYIERSYGPPPTSVRGMAVPPQMRASWRPGDVEWAQYGGRVLAVR